MIKMKQKLLLLILLLGLIGNSQNFSGKAYYKSKVKLEKNKQNNSESLVLSMVKQMQRDDMRKSLSFCLIKMSQYIKNKKFR